MSMTNADAARIAYTLGIRAQLGLAMGYPDLVRMLNRIYIDKVSKLPWVPPTWLAAVQALQAKYPNDLMRPTPGYDAIGRRGQEAPSFADTDAKLTAWDNIRKAVDDAIVAYAAKQAEIGAAKLRQLEADAAFWDGAYRLAVTVRDLPSNVVSGAARGVSSFVGTFLPESLKAYAKWITWAIVLLIVAGVIAWYRGKLSGIVSRFKTGKA